MKPPVVVPDASVLIKWSFGFPGEKDQDRALEIRNMWIAGRHRIVLPSLWIYEVGNILGLKQPDLARDLLDAYVGYHFEEEHAPNLYFGTLDIVKRCGVTFYDAAYHCVAIRHRGTLVTADEKYVRKALPLGHVTLLKEWAIE